MSEAAILEEHTRFALERVRARLVEITHEREVLCSDELLLEAALEALRPTGAPGTEAPVAGSSFAEAPVDDVFATLRKTREEQEATKADRLARIADIAVKAITDGCNPIQAVAYELGLKESTAAVYISDARRAGHDIPRARIPAEPTAPTDAPVPDFVALAVPTHREIAEIANKARTGDDAVQAVVDAFGCTVEKAVRWILSCRDRGLIVDPAAWTVEQAQAVLEEGA